MGDTKSQLNFKMSGFMRTKQNVSCMREKVVSFIMGATEGNQIHRVTVETGMVRERNLVIW